MGNDGKFKGFYYEKDISIHVPSWGTTGAPGRSGRNDQFQSTFPRGERRWMVGRKVALMSNFNPRSLVGNDMNPPIPVRCLLNFNPRSLVGNDLMACVNLSLFKNFNPRSLVGNDNIVTLLMESFEYFNPRSLVGNDGERGLSG